MKNLTDLIMSYPGLAVLFFVVAAWGITDILCRIVGWFERNFIIKDRPK